MCDASSIIKIANLIDWRKHTYIKCRHTHAHTHLIELHFRWIKDQRKMLFIAFHLGISLVDLFSVPFDDDYSNKHWPVQIDGRCHLDFSQYEWQLWFAREKEEYFHVMHCTLTYITHIVQVHLIISSHSVCYGQMAVFIAIHGVNDRQSQNIMEKKLFGCVRLLNRICWQLSVVFVHICFVKPSMPISTS